jgi:hypothetical protein
MSLKTSLTRRQVESGPNDQDDDFHLLDEIEAELQRRMSLHSKRMKSPSSADIRPDTSSWQTSCGTQG